MKLLKTIEQAFRIERTISATECAYRIETGTEPELTVLLRGSSAVLRVGDVELLIPVEVLGDVQEALRRRHEERLDSAAREWFS